MQSTRLDVRKTSKSQKCLASAPQLHATYRRNYPANRDGIPLRNLREEYSVEFTQRVGKWFFYEQIIKVPRYVIFRATTAHLEVYALESERYKLEKPDDNGRFWIPGLNLFLGIWEGSHESRTGYWLRWWNAEGELLLWSEERADQERLRADRESLRAERLAEKLRQAGIELDDEE